MIQSTLEKPAHTAIIMDGNGRWAETRGWARLFGHRAGTEAVRRVIEAAPRCGIHTLTLYAFSSDNWKRPPGEVRGVMTLLRHHLRTESARCAAEGVRISVIGRRDRLSAPLLKAIAYAENLTSYGAQLHVRIAIDYSARDSILRAAQRVKLTGEEFTTAMGDDVDLLIRTGGEQRLSDFLLWESAYAELVFTPKLWPDFTGADLESAVQTFAARERRFGGAPQPRVLGQSWFQHEIGIVRDHRGHRWLR